MPSRPDKKLIIIGAPKSGTTSIARWLNQHPDIALGAKKEPAFFTDFTVRQWAGPRAEDFATRHIGDAAAYEANFENDKNATWAVDASTDYLSHPEAAARIADYAKSNGVKLACILRDPVSRAFSEYAHTIRDNFQESSFLESLEREKERTEAKWIPLFHHTARSDYAAGLKRYQALFPPEQLLIMPFEEVKSGRVLSRLVDYLGIAPFDFDTSQAENVSRAPKSQSLRRLMHGDSFLKRLGKALLPSAAKEKVRQFNTTRLEMTEEEGKAAYSLMADQIAAAQALVPFDASHWTPDHWTRG